MSEVRRWIAIAPLFLKFEPRPDAGGAGSWVDFELAVPRSRPARVVPAS